MSNWDERLEQLLAPVPDETLRAQIRLVLTDEYAPPELFRALAERYDNDGIPGAARGAVGLVHLLWHVDQARSTGSPPKAGLMQQPEVREAIRSFYELPDRFTLADSELVAVGDMSFVIETYVAEGSHCVALKCLLPWCLISPTLRTDLAVYLADRRKLRRVTMKHVALVEDGDSGAGWVATEFVPGITLEVWLARTRIDWAELPGVDDDEKAREWNRLLGTRIKDFEELAVGLARCLARLEACGEMAHGDLRPENVILREDQLGDPVLVDSGPPPEVMRRAGSQPVTEQASPTLATDLPSYADLLLAVLVPAVIPPRNRVGNLTREELEHLSHRAALEELRRIAPRIGVVLDGLLTAEPRVPETITHSSGGLYERLEGELTREFVVYNTMRRRGGPDPLTAVRAPANWLRLRELAKLGDILSQRRYAQEIGDVAEEADHDWPRIQSWMRSYAFAWKLIYAAFLSLLLLDVFREIAVNVFSGNAIHKFLYRMYAHLPGGTSSWAHHAPVGFDHTALLMLDYRFVSLTTAGIAFAYYLNIFSTLQARPLARHVDLNMRLGPLVAMLMQLACMIFWPYAFAWVAGVAGLFICLNNVQWLHVLKATLGEDDEAYRAFRQWPVLMLFFCIGGIVIGVLLDVGWLKDAWFFAIALWALNIAKVFNQNCTRDAPMVRGWLSLAAYLHKGTVKLSDIA